MWHHWDYEKHLICLLDIFNKQVSFNGENSEQGNQENNEQGNQTLVSHMENITQQHKDKNFIFECLS